MPTLDWIGKDKVVNHHQDVPFKVLERQYSFDENGEHKEDNGSENMIIHGDNLEALKSLLPQYEGRINCIYIDPPYNTGNEKWVYNDNVNDPRIKKWLGEVVGTESEDLSRHDKWLCMMYPRLKLLHKLLADDGAIFISIGDHEQANLKLLCNEIFGERNFFAQIIVQSNIRGQTYKQIAKTHEYIFIYTKTPDVEFNELEKEDENNDLNLDDNIGKFNIRELRNRNPKFGKFNRPNLFYPFYVNPTIKDKDGFSPISLCKTNEYYIEVYPYNSKNEESCWRWGSKLSKENIAINTLDSNLVAKQKKDGNFNIYEKYRKTTYKAKTIWLETEMITERGTVQLGELNLANSFDFPKPIELVLKCLKLGTNKESIVLDSFAGSGTTGQAVLSLNKLDNGNRKFILIEMMEYSNNLTTTRLKKTIQGYNTNNLLYSSTGGNFSFYELGQPLLIDNNLNEDVSIDKIREYIYFTETKNKIKTNDSNEKYLLDTHLDTTYYFYYDKDNVTTLNNEFLGTIQTKSSRYVIYADLCTLSEKELLKYNITFKKIPRDIQKL